ncbi:MAG: NACHT domain-containing protein [Sphingobium sp.]|uniref:NACHT domain-containing protein n=3 Tax=Sphingobium TaxID=165695 RepID=UPI0017C13D9C|nr:NACHT domain-containing protein [Sphingobium sp.]MBA4753734.1 NACHT domain-containing protein [Sphingobium sp.]MBU0658449.1 NACHT domain-containing protein [Alphaproteobacteria bacterium]MBU1258924.1 NACHT domain-containing protein [Alphaproteobacteria bacterium]MBU1462564.1 NACHT domain-containing protein [Alphaproteobacteria bacterium]
MVDIATALAGTAMKAASPPVSRLIGNVGKRRFDAIVAKYINIFTDYLKTVREKTSTIKNLVYKDQAVGILNQYVHIEFGSKDSTISDTDVSVSLRSPSRFLISGTAGAGKTMFMKWCALDIMNSMLNHQMIPLFLELRDIDRSVSESAFSEILFTHTSSNRSSASFGQFVAGLEAGMFIIMLDAVDEINPEYRDRIIKSVREFCRDFPLCPMIISSRHDPRLESMPEFSVLKTRPMKIGQIIEVIGKVDYDKEVRDKLISELKSGLYERHKSFLSNPLLATIMLLTYDQTADIPNKVTLFYKQAFETLYQRHDAAKGVYKRGHHAGLPLDEFESIFSAFCYRTYINSKYEFSESELLRFFREAIKFCGIESNTEFVVKDSIESVCLIQPDGLVYIFSHRSFQEYFTAVFLSLYRGSDSAEVMQRALNGHRGDNVIEMLHEINPYLFENSYILPNIIKWISKVERLQLDTASGITKFLQASFGDIEINQATGQIASYHLPSGSFAAFCAKIETIYPSSQIYRHLFIVDKPIFFDLDQFLENNSLAFKKIKRWKENRDESFRLTISPTTDSKWLVKSDFGARLEMIRFDIIKLRDEIELRIKNKNSSMKTLLGPI